jgi:FkbM family methyltransferase
MKARFAYRLPDRLRFFFMYFVRKVFLLWFEVRRPKLRMFLYEMMYSSMKFIDRGSLMPSPFRTELVETGFGRFRVRPRTVDMSNVSPAFERDDINYLLRLLGRLRAENKKTLFLDIGADLGTFTVTVGNRFRDWKDLRVMAFEPAPSSCRLLRENIALNGLDETARAFETALWSEDKEEMTFKFNPLTPGSSGLMLEGAEEVKVAARKLDGIVGQGAGEYDAMVLKIDVEGVESEVLKGAERTLSSVKEIYLLVEDFINPEVIGYLEGIGAEFVRKLTPYNSWWRLRAG